MRKEEDDGDKDEEEEDGEEEEKEEEEEEEEGNVLIARRAIDAYQHSRASPKETDLTSSTSWILFMSAFEGMCQQLVLPL